jgi:hypothetical protein
MRMNPHIQVRLNFVVVRQYTPRPKDEDEFVTKEVQTDRQTEAIS